MAELTSKQLLFVQEYLIDLNATQAAIRAGYSEDTAGQIGYENLKKPEIEAAISAAMKEREERTKITQDMVVKELAKIGFADIKDYLSFRTEKTIVDRHDDGKPIIGYAQVIDVKDSDDIDGAVVSEVQLSDNGNFKFKLYDKKGALELLGKHLRMFTDKVELTTEGELNINIKRV